MIKVKVKGNYKKANSYLEKLLEIIKLGKLDIYGRMGVLALRAGTPRDSGKTQNSWDYAILRKNNNVYLEWINNNTNKTVNIALLIQYGHATRNGGYVQGIDYINPSLKPVFDAIAIDISEEIKRL